jgi:hypothetical protein
MKRGSLRIKSLILSCFPCSSLISSSSPFAVFADAIVLCYVV